MHGECAVSRDEENGSLYHSDYFRQRQGRLEKVTHKIGKFSRITQSSPVG